MAVLLGLISFGVFALLYVAPGDPITILIGTRPHTPETVALLRHQYHLDQPFFTQYWTWLRNAVHLQFGDSIQTRLPVTDELRARLPVSLLLGGYAFVLTMAAGVGLGMVAALRRGGLADRAIVSSSVVSLSMPAYASAILLLYLFAIVLPWFPAFGKGTGFFDELRHLTLPAIALAVVSGAFVVRHTRAAMVNVLDQDYVTFALARGIRRRRVLLRYALRNAVIPIITISGLTFAALVTGAVLAEVVFSVPGIGSLLVKSATSEDLPMIQGVAMVIAVVIMTSNLIADLLYFVLDPRIRRFGKA
jgi:peptide/nickel transport system permease protein